MKMRRNWVLPGFLWVSGEQTLSPTPPTKALLPFVCTINRPPRTGERPMAGSDEGNTPGTKRSTAHTEEHIETEHRIEQVSRLL